MLARKNRLSGKGIAFIMRKGKRLQTPYFTLVASSKHRKNASFTVIVSNKSANTAPRRARIKRRLRSMIRKVYIQEHASQYDCIFIAKTTVENASWPDLVLAGQKCFDTMHHISS